MPIHVNIQAMAIKHENNSNGEIWRNGWRINSWRKRRRINAGKAAGG